MSLPGRELVDALAPVRAALLAAARAQAEQTRARAEADATRTLADAQAAAARIREEARASGRAGGLAAAASQRNRAHREARAGVQRAHREAYQRLQAAAREQVARLAAEPDYPQLYRRLAAAVTRALGQEATVREAESGGVVGEAPGRRVDLSLASFADRAVRTVVGRQEPAGSP